MERTAGVGFRALLSALLHVGMLVVHKQCQDIFPEFIPVTDTRMRYWVVKSKSFAPWKCVGILGFKLIFSLSPTFQHSKIFPRLYMGKPGSRYQSSVRKRRGYTGLPGGYTLLFEYLAGFFLTAKPIQQDYYGLSPTVHNFNKAYITIYTLISNQKCDGAFGLSMLHACCMPAACLLHACCMPSACLQVESTLRSSFIMFGSLRQMHFMKYLSLQKFIAAKFEGSAECLSARGDLGLHSTSCKGPFQVASGSPLWCAESLSADVRLAMKKTRDLLWHCILLLFLKQCGSASKTSLIRTNFMLLGDIYESSFSDHQEACPDQTKSSQ